MDTNEKESARKPDMDPTHELPIPHDMELPPPYDMELPPPHDMLLKPHFTHKHPWLHWTPALFGLLIGIFIGIFLTQGAPENRQQINQYYTLTPTPLTTTITPPPNDLDLIKTVLPNGTLKITNSRFGFEIVGLKDYKVLSYNTMHLSFGYLGPNSDDPVAGPNDIANFNLNVEPLNGSLEDKVKDDYKRIKQSDSEIINFDEISSININGIKGFSYSCPFLIAQDCIYFPLRVNNYYLFILRNYSDYYNRGYKVQLDQILYSLKYIDDSPIPSLTRNIEQTYCTLDIKQCPDGSFVNRVAPSCEFLPCTTQHP